MCMKQHDYQGKPDSSFPFNLNQERHPRQHVPLLNHDYQWSDMKPVLETGLAHHCSHSRWKGESFFQPGQINHWIIRHSCGLVLDAPLHPNGSSRTLLQPFHQQMEIFPCYPASIHTYLIYKFNTQARQIHVSYIFWASASKHLYPWSHPSIQITPKWLHSFEWTCCIVFIYQCWVRHC